MILGLEVALGATRTVLDRIWSDDALCNPSPWAPSGILT